MSRRILKAALVAALLVVAAGLGAEASTAAIAGPTAARGTTS
jgi:hypothetical protein